MYNLLDRQSFLSAQTHKEVSSQLNGVDPNDVYDQIDIYNQLQVDSQFFYFNELGEVRIRIGDTEDVTPIKNVIAIARKLNDLSKYKNFQSFANGYTSIDQINSTVFEIDCCHFLFQKMDFLDIEFEPEVIIDSKSKYPEAKYTLDNNEELFIECKSLLNTDRARRSKIKKLWDELTPKLTPLLNPIYRLEISITRLPSHWNRNYADQLVASANELLKRQYTQKHLELNIKDQNHKTWIKLCNIDDEQYFKNTINLGNFPQGSQNTLVLGEVVNIKKDIKNSIKDALTQLPDDKYSLIFIYSLNKTFATQAIEEFFRDNDKSNLVSIVSWTDKIQIHHNPKCSFDIINYLKLP